MSYIYVLHAHTDVYIYIYICFFLSISLQINQSTNQQRAYHSMARLYGAPGARPAAALCEAMGPVETRDVAGSRRCHVLEGFHWGFHDV